MKTDDFFPVPQGDSDAAASGTAGDCRWTVTGAPGNRTLVISGNGEMGDDRCLTLTPMPRFCRRPRDSFRNEIKTLVIESGVTYIDRYMCSGCSGLTSIVIPDSVKGIGEWAFSNCIGLTSIVIPDSVTSIGNGAFFDCSGLTSILIPDSVRHIGDRAFSACRGLTSILIPDSVTSIDNRVFDYCRGLTSILIPDSVTGIGEQAFLGCSSLTSILIPRSVTDIGEQAFAGCRRLTSITSLSAMPPDINRNSFDGVNTKKCILRVPAGAVYRYGKADGWRRFKNIAEI